MKRLIHLALAVSVFLLGHSALGAERPNILFIAMDDQNDWIGHMGGHPLAKTPNLDRLAARGTTFLNAHVQSPSAIPRAPASCSACGPPRPAFTACRRGSARCRSGRIG